MFRIGGAVKGYRGVVATLGVLALSTLSHAATATSTLGQYNGNASSTFLAATGNFSNFYAAATASSIGHTVETPEAITAASLKNNSHFIIAAPQSAPSASALSALRQWVMDGGVLLLMADPNANAYGGAAAANTINSILAQLGSNMSVSTAGSPIGGQSSFAGYASLTGNSSAVTGGPNNISNGTLSTLAFFPVVGGTGFSQNTSALNNLMRVGNLNSGGQVSIGQIYVFGNSSLASNGAIYTNSNNRSFFINLLGQNLGVGESPGASDDNPEPATVTLVIAGIAGVVWYRRRKA